jgi:hypothetical protein
MTDAQLPKPDAPAGVDGIGRWFVRREGVVRGPYASTQVRRLLLSDALSLADMVSDDGQHWQPLASVPEVVPHQLRCGPQALEQELLQEAGAWRRQARIGLLGVATLIAAILLLTLFLQGPDEAVVDCAAVPAPGVDWRDCRFAAFAAPGAELQGVILSNAVLPGARLQGTVLREGDLRFADLQGADLNYADLRSATLKGADLRGADLTYADLRGADLSFADLRQARLGGARLEGALLHGALWIDGRTCGPATLGTCAP